MNSPLQACTLSDQETLRFRVVGSGPLRLVLLHGLAARSETWTDLIPFFSPDRYTVYLLDILGSGESSKPRGGDYSIAAHAARLLLLLDRLSLGKVMLVGHSLGGAIVLFAAILAQREGRALLNAAVIIGGPGFIQRLPVMAELFGSPWVGALFVASYIPEALVKIGLKAAYHDQRLVDREHIARYTPCYRGRDAKRALVATCRSLVPPDADAIVSFYETLRLPVLLLWGRQDRIVPLSQGERLNQALPASSLEVIESCGHNPQEERPEETFARIERFTTEVVSSSRA